MNVTAPRSAILKGGLLLTAFLASAAPASPKPNFLVLLGDDLGHGELGCQGNPEIPTPHCKELQALCDQWNVGLAAPLWVPAAQAGADQAGTAQAKKKKKAKKP